MLGTLVLNFNFIHMNKLQNEIFRKRGHRILGTNNIESLEVKNCIFDSCSFGYNKISLRKKCDTVQDCFFENCTVQSCLIGPAIIRNSQFYNIKNNMLICWGTFFDRVTLRGKIGPLMLHGIPSGHAEEYECMNHKIKAKNFYSNVEIALDISEAQFSDFCIRTSAMPLSLIRRDVNTQFIISNSKQLREPQWIESLVISPYAKLVLRLMQEEGTDEILLVAPKLDNDLYSQVLKDAEILAKEGVLT